MALRKMHSHCASSCAATAQATQPLHKGCTATAQATQPLHKGCTATAQGLYKPFSYVVRDYSLHHRCLHYCCHCLHCLHHCDVLLLYLDTARHQKKRPNSETTDLGAFLILTIFGYLLISKKRPYLWSPHLGAFLADIWALLWRFLGSYLGAFSGAFWALFCVQIG